MQVVAQDLGQHGSIGRVVDAVDVRRFRPDDASMLTKMLHRAYAELGAAGLNFTAVDQDEETTLRRASGGESWVMTSGNELVAAMTMTFPPEAALQEISQEAAFPNRAWLNQLAVDPTFRGQGLASRLWIQGRRWARSTGASHVGLDTAVPATHQISLYSGWGFQEHETIQWPGKTYKSTIMLLTL